MLSDPKGSPEGKAFEDADGMTKLKARRGYFI